MKKYIVERILPGTGMLTTEELQLMSSISCEVIAQMGKPYYWIHSYIGVVNHLPDFGDMLCAFRRLNKLSSKVKFATISIKHLMQKIKSMSQIFKSSFTTATLFTLLISNFTRGVSSKYKLVKK